MRTHPEDAPGSPDVGCRRGTTMSPLTPARPRWMCAPTGVSRFLTVSAKHSRPPSMIALAEPAPLGSPAPREPSMPISFLPLSAPNSTRSDEPDWPPAAVTPTVSAAAPHALSRARTRLDMLDLLGALDGTRPYRRLPAAILPDERAGGQGIAGARRSDTRDSSVARAPRSCS